MRMLCVCVCVLTASILSNEAKEYTTSSTATLNVYAKK